MNKTITFFTILFTSIFLMSFFGVDSNSQDTSIDIESSNLLEYEKNSIKVYRDMAPTVVNVTNITKARDWFFGEVHEIPQGAGSGFIWDAEGHIVTNYHVVHGGSSFMVTLAGGKEQFEAKVVGKAPNKDIAVLKLKKKPANLTHVTPGDSKNLLVGQKVIAIGNPFGFDRSLSVGILSAKGREMPALTGVKIRDMIQTDAAINPGNSGGPLLDSQGKLIGMNTMIVSPSGSNAGLGFAVPVDTIKRIVPQLIKHGKIIRPGLGVAILEEPIARRLGIEEGVVIASVDPQSGAAKAGLKGMRRSKSGRYFLGDIILEVEGKKVNNLDDIYQILDQHKVGDMVEVKYRREESIKTSKVKLQALP